jgi:hypothetical protein
MKTRFLMTAVSAIALSAFAAGSARAGMIAGWDFSQYLGAGVLSTDGATGANTLDANYSNLDSTAGAGAESAAFGTMYINGQFGSTNVDPFGATQEFLPTSGSLNSNLTVGVPGSVQFDAQSNLVSEGQQFFNLLSMTAAGAANVVFEADLNGGPLHGSNWVLSFGGKTFSGTTAVGIALSTDGVNYTPFGSVNLDANDTPFSVSFGGLSADTVYARLSFAAGGGQAIIDNLALSATTVAAPEPSALVLLGAGLAVVGVLRRRHA